MCERIVAFNVAYQKTLDPEYCGFKDKEFLKLNIHPEYLLLVGPMANFLGDTEMENVFVARTKTSSSSGQVLQSLALEPC